MTTLPNMGLVLPVRGSPGSGAWGDTIDANYSLEDAHDHTTGKGVAVPTAGININADLSFSSLYAPINLHRLTFASVAALAANNKSLFVSSSDNELYWRSNAGNNVKLTSGSALNVAAFVGGIGGDYTAVSAAEAFDDANKRYTFKDGSGNWARLASGDVRLIQTGTTESVFVGLAAPTALAGSYTVTMPLAAPASTELVSMSSAGVLSAAGTHGDRIRCLSGANFVAQSGTITYDAAGRALTGAAATLISIVPFNQGDRIKSVTALIGGDGAVDITDFNIKKVSTAGVATSIGSTTVTNATGADVTVDVTDTTLASGEVLLIVMTANAANALIASVRITYDRP